jgi:hypothetical protein
VDTIVNISPMLLLQAKNVMRFFFANSGTSSEVGRRIGRDGERDSARLALFRNSDSFRQAARGVEVRERLATLSARYPASSVDVEKAPQRASSLSCVNFSLQRTSSSGVAGAGEFYNTEVFKYGSQRYGAPGSSLNTSLGRLGSLNERELQEARNSTSAEPLQEASSSSVSSEQWTTVDLTAADTPKTLPDVVTTRKPRSGPLTGKQVTGAHRKTGSGWDQRVRTERGSFRGLRGSFSLHRSASEGRAQIFAMEQQPPEPTALNVDGRPALPGDADTTTTLAQRTIQWLSGGSKHTRSSSAAAARASPELQQIVTE